LATGGKNFLTKEKGMQILKEGNSLLPTLEARVSKSRHGGKKTIGAQRWKKAVVFPTQ